MFCWSFYKKRWEHILNPPQGVARSAAYSISPWRVYNFYMKTMWIEIPVIIYWLKSWINLNHTHNTTFKLKKTHLVFSPVIIFINNSKRCWTQPFLWELVKIRIDETNTAVNVSSFEWFVCFCLKFSKNICGISVSYWLASWSNGPRFLVLNFDGSSGVLGPISQMYDNPFKIWTEYTIKKSEQNNLIYAKS